jgi:ornithine--oxo-acid transaminase
VLGVLKPGEHGSTFGGNPLAAAVARTALRVLVDEGMIENSAQLGAYFLEQLAMIRSDLVKEVRGRGLMLAIELHQDAGGARPIIEALQQRGLLAKDTHENTLRIAPPLVITRNEVDWALEQIAAVLAG